MKNALELKRSIDEYRQIMNDLAMRKGINDLEVLKISQELDQKIVMFQKTLTEILSK